MSHQNNDIPDSWEDAADDLSPAGGDGGSVSNVTSSFSKFNVNAVEFVPTWGAPAASASIPNPAAPVPATAAPAKTMKAPSGSADGVKKSTDGKEKKEKEPVQKKDVAKKEPTAQSLQSAVPELEPEGEAEEEEVAARPAPVKKTTEGPKKDHLNIVFIGHVDAGKSTIGGHLLLQTGSVDQRTMDKYEREAKEASRESWYLSWALDTNPEERDKGKTVEVGRSCFETEKKAITVLDAPGHKGYVANMLEGASQADIGILVISARKGEFETGFDRGGQTREHALLAKTTGVKQLIVVINKMDDPTVLWSEERYNECRDKLIPYLKQVGYNLAKDIVFMPLSGYTGANLKDPMDKAVCSWYDGPSLLGFLDSLPPFPRSSEGPLRVPIIGRFKEMGTVITGKVESGSVKRGDQLLLMPNRIPVEAIQIWSDESEVDLAQGGDNVRIKLKGVEEDDVQAGFILCDAGSPCKTGKIFDAQVAILEHKNIICAGYSAIMHMNSLQEPVSVLKIICLLDKKTGKKTGDPKDTLPKFIKPGQLGIIRFECADGVICMDTATPQLAKFTLRDEGKTVGFGKIVKIVEKPPQ